jgi:uncharacterized protein
MTRVETLRHYLEKYYTTHGKNLLYHGWHHIVFVTDKAMALAKELNYADVDLVAACALTHDLNYLVDSYSRASEGQTLSTQILTANGYKNDEIIRIQQIVDQADIRNRDENICIEAQIVSDADTLFKALPLVAPVFTGSYLAQTKIGLGQLADSITGWQQTLFDRDIYFYTKPYRERYQQWAEQNFNLWKAIQACLNDDDVKQLLINAGIKP